MGTSASHPGSGSGTPLVPSWADPDNPAPSPPADPKRFRDFRRSLGRFAAGGRDSDLRAAQRDFAAKALGGAPTGARRFTGMAGVGADAIRALRQPGGVARVLEGAGVDLDALRGAPAQAVIEALARVLAPDNADRDKVEQALREAFSEVVEDGTDLDRFGGLTEDQQAHWMAAFLEGCVLQQILTEGAAAMDKAATPAELIARENQLRAAIQSAIAVHLEPAAAAGVGGFVTRDALVAAQSSVVESVLRSWEEWGG